MLGDSGSKPVQTYLNWKSLESEANLFVGIGTFS